MMKGRIYKKPPINEMYMGVRFQADPPVAALDFQQFACRHSFPEFINKDYLFPFAGAGGGAGIIGSEPEKIWFQNRDKTKLLQFARDRVVYNWRISPESRKTAETETYPKYTVIKAAFFKYWRLISKHITDFKERKLNVTMHDLYYSNLLSVGEGRFLKTAADLQKAVNITPFPAKNKDLNQITLQFLISGNPLTVSLSKADMDSGRGFSLILRMTGRPGAKGSAPGGCADIDQSWYDAANQEINRFFEEITTEEARSFWKNGGGQ